MTLSELIQLPQGEDRRAKETPPPIYVRLTAPILAAWRRTPPKRLSLTLNGANAEILAEGRSYQAVVSSECGYLDAYVQAAGEAYVGSKPGLPRRPRFVRCGRVKQRLTLRALPEDAAHPAVAAAAAAGAGIDFARCALLSDEMRVLHLLALAPSTPAALTQKTGVPLRAVSAILDAAGERARRDGTVSYCLRPDHYKYLRIDEWKAYSPKDRRKVAADAVRAFDALQYPPNHPARSMAEAGATAASGAKRTGSAGASAKAEPLASPPKPAAPVKKLPARTGKRKSLVAAAFSKAAKKLKYTRQGRAQLKNQASPENTVAESARASVPPSVSGNGDLKELARRFKNTYTEYSKLYRMLAKQNASHPAERQKLLAMHHDLVRWKRQLWSAAGDDSTAL